MTIRLALLAALTLSACGGGDAHPVSLGVTNSTSSLILSVTYALDGELVGAFEKVFTDDETRWIEATTPTPTAGSEYQMAIEFSSGKIETISVPASDVPAKWIHVGVDVREIVAEVSPGREVRVTRAARGGSGSTTVPDTLALTR